MMKLKAVAYHLKEKLVLNEVREHYDEKQLIKREHSFLLYKLGAQSYVYFKDYGSVVFINCTQEFIHTTITYFSADVAIDKLLLEEYELVLPCAEIEVDFGSIRLKELDDDTAHIIMLNLAQSVVLMNYVNKTSDLHDKTLIYSKQLEETGSFKLTKIKMSKFIGRTMNLKNNIAENLFVFDTPDLAWVNKDLSELDYKLKKELDIERRYKSIENSLDVIKENLDLFNGILQHKYSSMLEWIIILLILFEIIQVIIEKLI